MWYDCRRVELVTDGPVPQMAGSRRGARREVANVGDFLCSRYVRRGLGHLAFTTNTSESWNRTAKRAVGRDLGDRSESGNPGMRTWRSQRGLGILAPVVPNESVPMSVSMLLNSVKQHEQ